MADSFKHYLDTLSQALKAGTATEHTHRPALKALLEALDLGITATNEPRRIACGAPDYVVTRADLVVGYIEAKDVGKSLQEAERSDQLKRYLRSLENLILTDYLEFRWYVDGQARQAARLARLEPDGKIKADKGGAAAVESLLQGFLAHHPAPINTPHDLAVRLARLTHMIRDLIIAAFDTNQASDMLRNWRKAFAEILIADLDQPERTADFADMVAQTLAYGLFTARLMDPTPTTFSRQEAQLLIPKSNPFLRDFFANITGIYLEDEPFAPFVADLVNLLAQTDMAAILADFGRRTRQEDPVVHFYETFLAAYDPRLREARGVYYTPEPVVSYIVRSVDELLKTRFNCPQGLADSSLVAIPNPNPGLTVKGKKEPRKTVQSHKVLILDPATGTGTFLYAVVDHIRQQFMQQGNAGMWPGYVKNHLLPRLFGFELLMAPYAVAHFKLSLQLAGRDLPEAQRTQWAYYPEAGERLGVYLTNALEEPHEMTGLPLFTQRIADETNAANEVKQLLPILVMLGNPPYSVSSVNKGQYIEQLMERYKLAVRNEYNIQPLSDDYVKFIRFAHDRISRTGYGIVGIITNHAYLSGLIHRGMREELMKSFSEIYILNLHGNSIIGESAPDGSKDENVFDIQQGVAIAFFVKNLKHDGLAQVSYIDLWGKRNKKYIYLSENDISTTDWQTLEPLPPFFFFVPKDFSLIDEYEQSYSITQVFGEYQRGVATRRDHFMVAFDKNELESRLQTFASNVTDEEISERFEIKTTKYWILGNARSIVRQRRNIKDDITQYAYRPFDTRYITYIPELIERGDAAYGVMQHMLRSNKAILCFRRVRDDISHRVFVVDKLVDKTILSPKDNMTAFPLYLYPQDKEVHQKSLLDTSPWPPGQAGRVPNLNPDFVADLEQRLGLAFIPEGRGDLATNFGPEDIFHYIYAIFHAPTYRQRYTEFLKIDFPRVPLTSDPALFRRLAGLGQELVGLHLLEAPQVKRFITRYPMTGDNRVDKGQPKYLAPGQPEPGQGQPLAEGRVYLNKTQYFEGVPPEVWAFQVGGYQVCEKWLKDRQGRQLSYADLTHYQQIVVALAETIRLMGEIEAAIPGWPIE